MSLSDGYTNIPPGKLAAIVTSFEMRSKPLLKPIDSSPNWSLNLVPHPTLGWYRSLYRRIGEPWLWFSRLQMKDSELEAIVLNPKVLIFKFSMDDSEEGLLELDFRIENECEVAFFGLTQKMMGLGIGKWMMNQAIEIAWSKSIQKLWVHTCTLDGPTALPFYVRSGFQPVKRQLEVFDDPRVTGIYPKSAAPQIPII